MKAHKRLMQSLRDIAANRPVVKSLPRLKVHPSVLAHANAIMSRAERRRNRK